MRILFHLNWNFRCITSKLTNNLVDTESGIEFGGIVASGGKKTVDFYNNLSNPDFESIWDLENKYDRWLKNPENEDRFLNFQEKLGTKSINEILISDRHYSGHYNNGWIPFKSTLFTIHSDPCKTRRYIGGLLHYLDTIYSNFEPDLIFFYAVASPRALGMLKLAQHKNIDLFSLNHTRLENRFLLDHSERKDLAPVKKTFKKTANQPLEENFSKESLEWARNKLSEFRSDPSQPSYKSKTKYFQKLKRTGTFIGKFLAGLAFFPFFKDEHLVGGTYKFQKFGKKLTEDIQEYRRRICWPGVRTIPKDEEFVYYPLHLDPEASTLVRSPFQNDQLSIIQHLSKLLPRSTNIYIKEHDQMIGKRPKHFYSAINRISNAQLLHPKISTFNLIKKSQAVITITGTAGFEALLLDTPSIVIGSVPFSVFSTGINKITNWDDLAGNIKEYLNSTPPTDKELTRYLASAHTESFEFDTDLLFNTFPDKDLNEDGRKNVQFLAKKIKELVQT